MGNTVISLTGRGLRGESVPDGLRRTGAYGVLPGDTDEQALTKFGAGVADSTELAALLEEAQPILDDFALGDSSKIKIVSENIDAIDDCADNMAAIIAAPAAASAVTVAAAAIIPQAPAYTNPGGQGDRTASITVTTSGITGVSGTPDNLVDGVAASNATDAYRLPASTAVAGMRIIFDFGLGARRVITELVMKFQSNNSLATWKLRASNDLATILDIGATFTLATGATQTITTPSANVLGYRYYILEGVSGSTSATANYIQEAEFKIAVTQADGINPVPLASSQGDFLVSGAASNGQRFQKAAPTGGETTGLLAEWDFAVGTDDATPDLWGNYPINHDATYRSAQNSSPERTAKGMKLELDILESPSIPNVKWVATLYRVKRDAAAGFIQGFSSGTIGTGNGLQCERIATANTNYIGMIGGVAPVRAHTNGTYAFQTNRGNYVLFIQVVPTAATTTILWGGRSGQTAKDPVYRPVEMELAWSRAYSTAYTDAAGAQCYADARRHGMRKGILIDWRDTDNWQHVAALWGQSNALGRAALSGLPTAEQSRTFLQTKLQSSWGATTYGINNPELFDQLDFLEMGSNQNAENPYTGYTAIPGQKGEFGPEYGIAKTHHDARTTRYRTLNISKTGRGGTRLATSATSPSTTAAESWNTAESKVGSLLHTAKKHYWDTCAQLLKQGIASRPGPLLWMQGETDATVTSMGTSYEVNWQALWNEVKIDCFFPAAVIARIKDQWTSYDPTALAAVRAAPASLQSANPGEVTWFSTDTFTLDSVGGVHYDAQSSGQPALGAAFFNAYAWV